MGGIKVVGEKEVDWEVRLEVSTEFCGWCDAFVVWMPEAARPQFPYPVVLNH